MLLDAGALNALPPELAAAAVSFADTADDQEREDSEQQLLEALAATPTQRPRVPTGTPGSRGTGRADPYAEGRAALVLPYVFAKGRSAWSAV